jgi:hypothetical protein
MHSQVSHTRAMWEDAMNSGFERNKSPERVCWHPNMTVTVDDHLTALKCDYCPAWSVSTEVKIPAPWYFKDPDPLKI